MPRTSQELIHWLELGAGARWIRRGATLLGVLVFSLLVAWKQFHGPVSENTLIQADVARQLVAGKGFTTLVNYPQTMAFLAQRGMKFDAATAYPELHQAPLYSITIATALRVLPAGWRSALFRSAPVPPDGFGGDYFLLGLNLVLFWIAARLTFTLARRLFDTRTAWLAMLALLVSVGAWQQVVTVNGTPLLMVLLLAAFHAIVRVEEKADDAGLGPMAWTAAAGIACGLMFLAEYSAGVLVLVALAYVAWRFAASRRWLAIGALALGFALPAAPWVARNLAVSGNPVALASQNVALKAGDPTAEPATQRNTLSAAPPSIDLDKLGNKTLTSLQENLKSRLWSGGALWLAAFFVTGWLYPFRSATAQRTRWLFTAALGVLMLAQAALNSGESERLVACWGAPLMILFGAGFFFVLLGSNAALSPWPRVAAAALLALQALPLLHDALEPRRLHFQYPPYFPGLFMGMRDELARRDHVGRYGLMADVPAGVAWYAGHRVWSQPPKLRDFYAITLEQPMGELLLTPRTLDRPFLSELAARPVVPDSLGRMTDRFGEWGRIYSGLLTGTLPGEFPLTVPQRLAENLYVFFNPALGPPTGK